MHDFEAESLTNHETFIEIVNSGYLTRKSDDKIMFNQEFIQENKNLLKIYQEQGKVYIESMTENPLWIKQGDCEEKKRIAAHQEPMFLAIGFEDEEQDEKYKEVRDARESLSLSRSLDKEEGGHYVLKLHDVVKFGRSTFEVTQISPENRPSYVTSFEDYSDFTLLKNEKEMKACA